MPENPTRNELEVRAKKVEELRSQGIEPYPSVAFERSHLAQEIHDHFSQPQHQLANGEADPQALPLRVCGRITFKRDSGSIGFIGLTDASATIQLKIEKKLVTGDPGLTFNQIKKLLDIGDFIGVEGIGCRTNRGELSIQVSRLDVISKATIPFPDSYYAINDPELCRRHREIDLVVIPHPYSDLNSVAALSAAFAPIYGMPDLMKLKPPSSRLFMAARRRDPLSPITMP